jgi:mono/diheme cytochrome c family protein
MKAFLLGACVIASCLAAGCERQMKNMYSQPRYDWGEPSPLFPDGRAMRPPPQGSVPAAAGELAATSSGRKGREDLSARTAALKAASLPPVTKALLARGRERYTIYCLPCHSAAGDGDGPVVRHGFPRPPSYHEDRLRTAPDRHFFDVITNGYGVMASYADRVQPEDRWAVVAYIRALQFSRHAPVAALPAALRERVEASAPAAAASASSAASAASGAAR